MTIVPVDVLAIAAHPDDLELTCGGTIARLSSEGRRVGMVDLTRGELGTRGTPEIRKRESDSAAEILGASFRIQLDFGDGGLRTGREEELELIGLIRKTRPSLVIAPYPDDRHPDHARAGRLVTDAWFYSGLRQLAPGEDAAHRPQAVIYYLMNYIVVPTMVVDVTAHHETKRKAMLAFESQFHREGSDEPATLIAKKSFLDMIEGRSRHFGGLIGADFGEPFWSRTPPRIDDPIAAFGGREVS